MRVVWLLLFAVSIPTIAIVLLFTDPGSTSVCGNRPVVGSAANAAAFDARLQRLAIDVARTRSGAATFTESEASSRVNAMLGDATIGVSNVKICFWGDARQAQATGIVSLPRVPWPVHAMVSGTLDLSGAHPQLVIRSVRIGSLPGIVSGLVAGPLTSDAASLLAQVSVPFPLTLTLTDGAATVGR